VSSFAPFIHQKLSVSAAWRDFVFPFSSPKAVGFRSMMWFCLPFAFTESCRFPQHEVVLFDLCFHRKLSVSAA
jgi:hypothetical protein